MTYTIKVHVLCHTKDGEIDTPLVFPTHDLALAEMKKCFRAELPKRDGNFIKDETYLYENGAAIISHDDAEAWSIFKCNMEVNDIQGIVSAFEEPLKGYSKEFRQFLEKVMPAFDQAGSLIETLTIMQGLLSRAIPGFAAGMIGDDGDG